MAKVDKYREKVQQIIADYAKRLSSPQGDEIETVFDIANDHYLLMETAWRGEERDYGSLIHLDIKDDKIWIQYDGTEVGIANELERWVFLSRILSSVSIHPLCANIRSLQVISTESAELIPEVE